MKARPPRRDLASPPRKWQWRRRELHALSLEVAVALIDKGAGIERRGGSIGTPLDNAIGYACWHI
jgi:hypothetical protein